MKKVITLLVLMTLGAALMAQDKSTITVKKSEVSNGVVIVTITTAAGVATSPKNAKTSELNCNKGASACKSLDPGTYVMVRLPKNWGMYDCDNVDVYPQGADPDTSQKIGEYCLNEK